MSPVGLRQVLSWVGWFALASPSMAAGCSKPGTAASTSQIVASAQAAVVTMVHPERKSVQRTIEQPAFVEAYEETPLLARIPGHVQKVMVDIGDSVKGPRYDAAGKQLEPGQVLAELWVPEMEQDLRQKQALIVQAVAEVEQATAAVEAAEANIATANALVMEAEAGRERALANQERWESEYQRVEGLVQRKVIDDQVRDETRNQLKAAGAGRKEVEAKVGSARAAARESEAKRNKARADLAAAKAKVQVAQAEEGRSAAMLNYSKVRAPYDGVITNRNIHTGHYLSGSGTKPILVIARMDIVRVMVDVPEADAAFVSVGTPVRIRSQMIKEQEFEGKVTRSSWSLDPRSRTLRTEIDLSNPHGRLRPGMYAYVTFRTESPSGLTLPNGAVLTQGEHSYCYRVESGKALRMPVKVGARDSEIVQVLKKQVVAPSKAGETATWEDFTGKEQVIEKNLASIAEGQSVSITGAR